MRICLMRVRKQLDLLSLTILLSLFALLMSSVCLGQITTSTIVGTVTDKSDAAVPGAQVTATNTATNSVRTTSTNAQGEYRIEFLPVGNYSVSISASGFKKEVRSGVVLEVNVPARVDAALELGEVTQSVEVTGSAPLVNTTTTEVGRTIENQEIVNLPLVNRNAYQLLELTPGVQNSTFNPGQPNPTITLGYPEQRTFINGGVDGGAGSVSYYLDGGINMTALRNTGNILPNPDAIQEFRVETNNYNAEYGKMSGGVMTVVTKSGTNNYHGSLFEFWRDNALNANFWNSSLATPPLRRNQFGGTFGGPIKKDRTFFFASYQGLRQLSSFLFTGATVPTALERTGNFTASTFSGKPVTIPSQYTCGTKNVICPALLDPVAHGLLNGTGSLSIPTADVGATSFQGPAPSPYNTDDVIVKVDHTLSDTHRLTASYFETSGNNSVPPLNSTSGLPNGNIPWDIQSFNWRQHDLNLSDTWTPTSTFANQAWLTYTRNFGGRLNLPGTALGDLGSDFSIQGPHSLPQITVTSYFTGASAIAGPEAGTNFYSVRDVATKTIGRHTIAFGGEESLDKDVQQTLLNNYGVFTFNSNSVTDSVTKAKITVPGLVNFLLGIPTSISQDAPVTGYTNTWITGLFVQDDYRVRPNLTLNVGLRWDIQTPPTDPLNRESSFQIGQQSTVIPSAPTGALFVGDPGVGRGVVSTRLHHVSPRVGFAWDPTGSGKTSIRAGAGIFYGSVSGNEWNTDTNFEPFSTRFTFTNNKAAFSGSGATAKPTGATLSCPYINLASSFGSSVTCGAGSGAGMTGVDPFPFVYNPASPGFIQPGGSFFGFDKNFQWPYSYQFNFSIQRQFASDFTVTAAYVGNFSHDLPFAQDLNYPVLTANATTGNVVTRRPIDNATLGTTSSPFGTVLLVHSNQTASYNGLQLTAQKRMNHGLLLYAFYTYSKTFDSVQLDNNTTQGGAEDFSNLRLDRGPADFDQRHVFVASAVWQPNYYHGDHFLGRELINGWSFSPIVLIHSGLPFSIMDGVDANLDGNSTDRAELVPGVNPVLSNRSAGEWFNTAAFTQNPATTGVAIDGNSGRNMLYGPWFHDVDLAISRDFKFKERFDLQARGDAYNVFNIVSLSNPAGNGVTVGSSTFGQITAANPMRQLQIGLRLTF